MFRCITLACLTLLPGQFLQAQNRRAVEHTFLQANPGERENLTKFIVTNWFAMDKSAKAQGLIDNYRIFDTGTDEGPWNVLVVVTYRDEKGYDGIAEAFEKIRKQHKVVPASGKLLPQLGRIVDSKRLFETIP
jgi:hypothetical protein